MSDLLGAIGWVGDTLDKYTGGRALRGVLAGRPREALSVLPFSDSLGITEESDKASGSDVLRRYGLTSDTDAGAGIKSFLAEAVLDPSNFIGGAGLAKKGLSSLSKLTGPLDHLDDLGRGLAHAELSPALGAARLPPASMTKAEGGLSTAFRQAADFPMLRDFPSGPRITGGGGSTDENIRNSLSLLEQARGLGNEIDGAYSPTLGVGFTSQGVAPSWLTGRHERIHGIIDRSGKAGNAADLPMVMRIPANLKQSNVPLLRGIGDAMDEVAAQSLQYRAPLDQLRSGASFLFGMSPEEMAVRKIYGDIIRQTSPAAAAMFTNAYRAADPRTYLAAGLGGNLLRGLAYQGGTQGSP